MLGVFCLFKQVHDVVFGVLLLERYLVDGLHASRLLQLIYTRFYGVLIILIYTHDMSTLHMTSSFVWQLRSSILLQDFQILNVTETLH